MVEVMDLGLLYSEVLLLASVLISVAVTKKLSTLFHVTPLSFQVTRSDLKVTSLAVSLQIILLVSILSKAYLQLAFLGPVIWICAISFWVLSPLFAIIKGDFKLVGVSRRNLTRSFIIGIASSAAFVALFVTFLAFFPRLVEFFRAPIGGAGGPLVLAINLVVSIVNPALTEELAFRGLLQGRFQAHFSAITADIMQALIFGLSHITNAILYQDWLNPVNAILSGLVFGYIFHRTGNIAGSVTLHWFLISFSYIVAFATPT